MTTFEVTLELHDHSKTPPAVMWSGKRKVQAKSKALAFAQASLLIRRDPPIPNVGDLYTQILGAVELPPEEAL